MLTSTQQGNCAHWLRLQLELDLWQLGLPIPQCVVHSDAQGEPSFISENMLQV